ncbi:cytochrome P450 89A2-like [Zingiber officinale]|uniref:Cytochrome P450 n=1 Tax=Zingiber officinale TaxID=94328 RepID=A0A8J5KBY7_ZINOF|nr:cytochrome P450 89A2-like [Zingiber officinale]KAG6476941.1 hypothetical protein ZIOFF_066191 [Zingiber officinale]
MSFLFLSLFLFIPLSYCLITLVLTPRPCNGTAKVRSLPPGPPPLPLVGNLLWLPPSFSRIGTLFTHLRAAYGPTVTLYIGRRPAVFIMEGHVAQAALVHQSSAFARRPPPLGTSRALGSNVHTVNMTDYGPHWRLLRRAFASVALLPGARQWALEALVDDLTSASVAARENEVSPSEIFARALFRLFSLLCFGEELEESTLWAVREAQVGIISLAVKLSVFNLLPKIVLVVFWRRWVQLVRLRRRLDDLLIPIIRARSRDQLAVLRCRSMPSYLDALLCVELEEEVRRRRLIEEEIVNLCSEFLNASTETTSAALQWIMANLVKQSHVQDKLVAEIASVMGANKSTIIGEEEVKEMEYLKAVVLEGLRRHPPAHLLLPHTVAEEREVAGYVIPEGAVVNFAVAEMGRDEAVWKEAMEFRPERFMEGGEGEGVDLTGVRGIKMMPFGAGKRLCPGMGMAMLVLQYVVANLVWRFRWVEVAGKEVELAEEPGLTVGIKHPFLARLVQRTL